MVWVVCHPHYYWIWGQAISGRTTYTDPCCEEFDRFKIRKEKDGQE